MSAKKSKHIVKISTDLPNVTSKFVAGNQTFCKTLKSKNKKGGPYSNTDRDVRRDEVRRLHFEFGYSAKKISELMKINRNTINGDVQYWYSKTAKKWKNSSPESLIAKNIERLELQRTRLREELDAVMNFHEKITIENMILQVESKICQIELKLSDSIERSHKRAADKLNEWMKENKKTNRYLLHSDFVKISQKSYEKIRHLLKEE